MQTHYKSFCKINLGLEVLRRREDGYHDLNTVFYRLDAPFDDLHVEVSPIYLLTIEGSDLVADETNLVTRAIQACAEHTGTSMPGLSIRLTKRVPFGAGLGGGSANAAKAIEIFSEHVSPLTLPERIAIGRPLGADVPFFLQGQRAALASGIGDILKPIELQLPYSIIVAKPKNISIPTGEAYTRLHISGKRVPTDLVRVLSGPLSSWTTTIRNDFEPVAFDMAGALRKLKQRLLSAGAGFALLSGSGSAFFALFESREVAEAAFRSLSVDTSIEVFLS